MKIIIKTLLVIAALIIIHPVFASKTSLVLDSENNSELPRKFRITQGIPNLNAMGSAQFSEKNLLYVIHNMKKPAYIVDLRQESHGFLNGLAISWYGKNNWANLNKCDDEISVIQSTLLRQLTKRSVVTVYKIKPNHSPFSVTPFSVRNELDLVTRNGIKYLWLPIPDHHRPADKQVNDFVTTMKQLPPENYVYFHCRGGKGRTTTGMAMLDMMRNAKNTSLVTILERQKNLGGQNLLLIDPKKHFNDYAVQRLNFLTDFYHYCRCNKDGYKTNWMDWLKDRKKC